MEALQPMFVSQAVPNLVHAADVNLRRVEHAKEQPAVHLHIALVLESGKHGIEMRHDVFIPRICLLHEKLVGQIGIPGLGIPRVVCPAEAEREVGFAAADHVVEHFVEQALASPEPIMPIAEALDASLACQLSLLLSGLRHTKVVETQVAGDARLIVPGEKRDGTSHVGPFREAWLPPLVVLRRRIELRQIECYGAYVIHLYTGNSFTQYADQSQDVRDEQHDASIDENPDNLVVLPPLLQQEIPLVESHNQRLRILRVGQVL